MTLYKTIYKDTYSKHIQWLTYTPLYPLLSALPLPYWNIKQIRFSDDGILKTCSIIPPIVPLSCPVPMCPLVHPSSPVQSSALGNSQESSDFPEDRSPKGKSDDLTEFCGQIFQTIPEDFPLLSDFWIETVKIMRPRIAPRVNTELILVLL